MSIDWCAAIGGALVGWVASTKVDEAQERFTTTIAQGSAEGVKAAWKQAAKKAKKGLKKAGQVQNNQNGG